MAIKLIEFAPGHAPIRGRDIHLIRGDLQYYTSRSILDFGLTLTKVLANGKEKPMFASEYLHKHNDDVLKFLPTFKHIDNGTSANLTNFGIDVRRPSGIVRVDPGPIGKPFPGNSLLEITATHQGGSRQTHKHLLADCPFRLSELPHRLSQHSKDFQSRWEENVRALRTSRKTEQTMEGKG